MTDPKKTLIEGKDRKGIPPSDQTGKSGVTSEYHIGDILLSYVTQDESALYLLVSSSKHDDNVTVWSCVRFSTDDNHMAAGQVRTIQELQLTSFLLAGNIADGRSDRQTAEQRQRDKAPLVLALDEILRDFAKVHQKGWNIYDRIRREI